MKKALLYVALWIAAVSQAFASTRIIPVAGHVPGANNTAWITDVTLKNNSAAATSVELLFHTDSSTRSRIITLGAGASMLLEDAVAPAKFGANNPASWLGQLEIRSSADVTASAHIYTQGKNGGTFGSTYEGFDPAVLSSDGAIAGLVNSGRFRSNIAFSNPTDAAITITYTFRDDDGSVKATRTFDLPAHTTRQLSMAADVPSADDTLSLFWSATGRAYAVASIVDNESGDPTSAPSVSRDATSLFYPVIGRTAGANATFWSTSASVTATSGVAGSVTFAYTDSASGSTYTRTAVLPALGSVTTADVNDFVGAPAGTGSLRITSTSPVAAVVRVFNTLADGSTFGAAVLPQHDVVEDTHVHIEGVRRDRDYRLNVAVANHHTNAAEGRIRLFDDRGVEIENHPFRAEHGRPVQIGLTGNIDVHAGQLRIESENGVAVTATASNVDNVTGDTIQREAEQENERQNELEIAMSTRTAAVSAPITFSLKHAGSDIVAVNWQFGDGTRATGATVTHSYISAGEFNVTVEVTLASGAIVRDREDVRISGGTANAPSSAIDFTFTPAAPAPGEQVVFTAIGATNGGVFKWKFPGNIRPVGNTVTFTFPTAGAFEVEVEIEHGTTVAEVTRIVNVGGTPTGTPGAGPIDFTFSPATPQAGQVVTFTASGNTGGGAFKWKFPGDVRKFGNTATFTFPANGSFEVELEVEHGSVVAEITKIVNVGNTGTTNPGGGTGTGTIDFSYAPVAPAAGQEVTFTASGNTGGGTFKWKFPGDVRKLGNVVTFTFPTAGSYEVEVEVEHGTVAAEVRKIVTVGGGNGGNGGSGDPGQTTPLNFTFSPTAPAAGQAVTFTASGSTGGGIYKWSFPGNVRMTGPVVTFTFPAAGSFEVELEIEHGTITSEITKVVTVTGGSTGDPGTPGTTQLDFTYSPSAPRVGQQVTFTATGNTGGGT
ncbi:MAG: PKD domain-containing protein, partial [Acidobacteriota bacterium]|nr:PKD domain-containing protein [Acidobacteriota bacterium]